MQPTRALTAGLLALAGVLALPSPAAAAPVSEDIRFTASDGVSSG